MAGSDPGDDALYPAVDDTDVDLTMLGASTDCPFINVDERAGRISTKARHADFCNKRGRETVGRGRAGKSAGTYRP